MWKKNVQKFKIYMRLCNMNFKSKANKFMNSSNER